MLSDAQRHPFSLFIEAKTKQHQNLLHPESLHHQLTVRIERVGDVVDVMDKSIGRPAIRIKGAVSAKNYIDFDGLHLTGRYLHVQLCLIKSIATFHIELIMSNDMPLRISLSTLYSNEQPRFLGASLRIPLPLQEEQWSTVLLDMDEIINRYCSGSSNGHSGGVNSSRYLDGSPALKLKSIRRIQLCSNMVVRDVVVSDKVLNGIVTPKELAIKAHGEVSIRWIDVIALYPTVGRTPDLNAAKLLSNPNKILLGAKEAASPSHYDPQKSVYDPDKSHFSPAARADILNETENNFNSESTANRTHSSVAGLASRRPLRTDGRAYPRSPLSGGGSYLGPDRFRSRMGGASPELGSLELQLAQSEEEVRRMDEDIKRLKETDTYVSARELAAQVHGGRGDGISTPKSDKKTAAGTPSTAVVRPAIPETSPTDRVLMLDKILGYSGGPSLLLYDGKMGVLACGSLVVLVDVAGSADAVLGADSAQDPPGLWRAFRRAAPAGRAAAEETKHRQAFLRGHTSPVGILEVSNNFHYMISSETAANGTLLVWDLIEGKKVVTLKPHPDSIICAALSPDNSILVTVGTDLQRRVQIIAWDFRLLLLEKGVVLPLPFLATISTTQGFNLNPNGSGGLVMARQLSDFHISKIAFNPFDECGLVSAGRENIRFWRIKKGHLPGRPTQLNEFGRGFSFSDIAFYAEPGASPQEPRKPCVYVASSRGLLMKVCCVKEQLLCTYQLHNGPIRSLALRSGYAVTGGDDSRLRVWPLDFSDFLLEAHHEKAVTSISIARDGRKLIVGTTFGTLGVLDVSEHSYNTILRSHVGAVVAVAARGADARVAPEFATLGADCTIRVWDLKTLQQKFEFSSPADAPLSAAYHPTGHLLACGFESGWLRVFDVPATSTSVERRQHVGSVRAVVFAHVGDAVSLFTASMDGTVVAYDVNNDYSPLKTLSTLAITDHPSQTVRLAVSKDGKLLASSTAFLSSLTVYDTQTLAVVHKVGSPAAAETQGESANPNLTLPLRRRSSPGAEALLSHSFAAAVDALTIGGSLQVPLTGLVFNEGASAAPSLLISTDKHIISIPLDRSGKRGAAKWSDKMMKRVDFGVPRSMACDPHSGMLFLAVTAPQKSGSAAAPIAERADSVVVVGARLRPGTHDRLKLSSAQMFQSHSTSITDICAAFSSHGKVLSIDELGSVTVWSVLKERLDRLQAEGFSPDKESPAPVSAAVSRAPTADMRVLSLESSAAALDIASEPRPAEAEAAPGIMARKIEQKKVTGLARDFDDALNEEGRFEISSTSNIVFNTANTASVSIVATDTKSPAAVKSGSYDGAPAKKTRSASVTSKDLSGVTLNKSPGPKTASDAAAPRAAVKSAWEEVAAGPGVTAAPVALAQIDDGRELPSEETIFDFDLEERFEEISDLDTVGQRVANRANVLSIKNKIRPSICLPQRKFLVSNGSSVVIKSIDGGFDELLCCPDGGPADMDSVVASTLSPSGFFAAAVVSTRQPKNLPPPQGLFTDHQSVFRLIVWVQDRVTSGQWRLLGGAPMVVPTGSSNPVFLDWLADDSLVVGATASSSGSNISDGIVLSVLTTDRLLSGQLASSLRSHSQRLAYRGDLQGLRLLPSPSPNPTSRSVLAVMHTGPKIYLVSFAAGGSAEENPGAVVWSDDIGKKGPFTAVDVAAATGKVPDNASSLIVTLDSFSGIRLYIAYGGNAQPVPLDVSLPTNYTASSPRSLCLSPGARGGVSDSPSLVIGYTSSVLLYSLLFNQQPGRAITGALQHVYKVSLNFAPEYLLPLQRRLGEQPDVLVANSSGLIGYVASSAGSSAREMEVVCSPPLPRSPDLVAVCARTLVLVSISKGVVSLHDATCGIRLPMPSPGINNATCLAACSACFAVGSSCGRISIYDSTDMHVVRTIVNSAEARPARATGSKAGSKAVNSVLFMCSDDIIISAYEDGSVVATIINGGGRHRLAYKQLDPSLSGALQLVRCAHDDSVFGVLRGGCVLEIYRLSVATTRGRNHVSLIPNISPVISKAALVTVETALAADPALRGGGRVIFDKAVRSSSLHMARAGKHILVTAIAADSSSRRALLLCGAVDMTTIKDAHSVTSIAMHPRLSLGSRTPSGAAVCFAGDLCAIAMPAGVCTINVTHAAAAAAAHTHSDSLLPPLTLEEASNITSVPLQTRTSGVVASAAASWASSALALAPAPAEDAQAAQRQATRLFAYKSFGSSLFKVDL